jgi:tetratricopeptide (TPR) repeat protein
MSKDQFKQLAADLWSAGDNLRANSDHKSSGHATPARLDKDADDAVDQALEFAAQGDFAKGEKLLVGLLAGNSDLYILHFGMGTLLAMRGDTAESIPYFDRCLEMFPYHVEAWFNKGMAHRKLFDVRGSVAAFKKVADFGDDEDSFVTEAREILGGIEAAIHEDSGLSMDQYFRNEDKFDQAFRDMENNRFVEALAGFQEVLRMNPSHAQSHGNSALCHAFLGRQPEALAAIDRALEIDPDYEPALRNREVVRSLKEGEKLPAGQMQVVEHYKNVVEKERDGNPNG